MPNQLPPSQDGIFDLPPLTGQDAAPVAPRPGVDTAPIDDPWETREVPFPNEISQLDGNRPEVSGIDATTTEAEFVWEDVVNEAIGACRPLLPRVSIAVELAKYIPREGIPSVADLNNIQQRYNLSYKQMKILETLATIKDELANEFPGRNVKIAEELHARQGEVQELDQQRFSDLFGQNT